MGPIMRVPPRTADFGEGLAPPISWRPDEVEMVAHDRCRVNRKRILEDALMRLDAQFSTLAANSMA